jgi:hypothetical protein
MKSEISRAYSHKYRNALIAPKSGAPGKIALTDGRANRAVRQTPRMSVSYQSISILIYLWYISGHTLRIKYRFIITASPVSKKMPIVEVQLTTTATTAANMTSPGRRPEKLLCYDSMSASAIGYQSKLPTN